MRKKETPKERLASVLSALGVTGFAFEDKCGLAHGFTSRVTRAINKKTRAKIKAAYPSINIEYIAQGLGEMFEEVGTAHDTIKERLIQFQKYMNLSDVEFARKTKLSITFIPNLSDSPRKSSLEKIYRTFPMLSNEWLEYGKGEMIAEKKLKISNESVSDRLHKIVDFLGITSTAFESETGISNGAVNMTKNITKRTADKIVKRYPFLNESWLIYGNGTMLATQAKEKAISVSYAPLVPQRAYAGYLGGFADKTYISTLEKIPYLESPETKGNMVAFEVAGDSMDNGTTDGYYKGEIVLCRELEITDYRRLKLPYKHYDFVIVHKEGILLKQITEHNVPHGEITIHSLNTFYEDRILSLRDVMKIFVVIMKISDKKRR